MVLSGYVKAASVADHVCHWLFVSAQKVAGQLAITVRCDTCKEERMAPVNAQSIARMGIVRKKATV